MIKKDLSSGAKQLVISLNKSASGGGCTILQFYNLQLLLFNYNFVTVQTSGIKFEFKRQDRNAEKGQGRDF